jgi:hypothetical protein
MVFNTTFNNFSLAVSWRLVLLVEETGVPGKNPLYHIMLHRAHLAWVGFELTTLVAIGIDYIGSCQSNYHTIQGRIQDFKLGGAHLKKLRRAEGGANIFGVFGVKNHDFTPKNHIFSNFRGDARRVRLPMDPPLRSRPHRPRRYLEVVKCRHVIDRNIKQLNFDSRL